MIGAENIDEAEKEMGMYLRGLGYVKKDSLKLDRERLIQVMNEQEKKWCYDLGGDRRYNLATALADKTQELLKEEGGDNLSPPLS